MRSLLFKQGQVLVEPPGCGPKRQEARAVLRKEGRLYTVVLRDKVVVEDPYLVLVKAAAFAVREGEPYMGRVTPRPVRDFLIRSSVVVLAVEDVSRDPWPSTLR